MSDILETDGPLVTLHEGKAVEGLNVDVDLLRNVLGRKRDWDMLGRESALRKLMDGRTP